MEVVDIEMHSGRLYPRFNKRVITLFNLKTWVLDRFKLANSKENNINLNKGYFVYRNKLVYNN